MDEFNIGEFLRTRRKELNLSRDHVAIKAEIAPVTYARIEQGKTDPKFKAQLVPILEALNISLQEVHEDSYERLNAVQCVNRIQHYTKELRARLRDLSG